MKKRGLAGGVFLPAKKGSFGTPHVDAPFPSDESWIGAVEVAVRCSDTWLCRPVLIRKDRFATREPGFLPAPSSDFLDWLATHV